MRITPDVFQAFLKCPTKSWLGAAGEPATGNTYAEWVKAQTASYRATEAQRLVAVSPPDEIAISPTAGDLKTAKWRLASSVPVQAQIGPCALESELHAVERVPSEGRGRPAQFIPIRFVFRNKLQRNDKLLLAFDGSVLSEMVGREVGVGKIIHGDEHVTLKVKTAALAGEVRKLTGKIATLFSSDSPPDLVLNRHCAECEFQLRCRQKAVEIDDLSLLSGMTEKERAGHRSKGIFTVTQLSYTFRPRKTPKRAKNPAKPHHFALQALAIREKTIYIHGSPHFPESKTQVYLDIEGLPDGDLYYLIGALVVADGRETFHSFWADSHAEEPAIITQFVELVSGLTDFRIFHYGDYESAALRRIKTRQPNHAHHMIEAILSHSTNVLSSVYPHIYFPTYSNSLKEIAKSLGFTRQHPAATGLDSIIWRKTWETDRSEATKTSLLCYNKDDCLALKQLCRIINQLNLPTPPENQTSDTLPKTSRTEELRSNRPRRLIFGRTEYALEDFNHVVKCAYFDYQREKVFVRTDRQLRAMNKQHRKRKRTNLRPNQKIELVAKKCRFCRTRKIEARKRRSRLLFDLKFTKTGVKKWIVQTTFSQYRCFRCGRQFSSWDGTPHPQKYGHGLMSWCVYWNVFGGLSMFRIRKGLGDLFGLFIPDAEVHRFKGYVKTLYESLYAEILENLLHGPIIHVDETTATLRGQTGYVWVMASMDKAYYFFRPSREGSFLEGMLTPFHGVLISDFFTAYDSLPCQQQKCLVHLVRDIDDDLLRNPLDAELKVLAQDFGFLLRTIVSTVDQYGLKQRHLQKHVREVKRFLKAVASSDFSSELANKYQNRFEKSGLNMFTFLDHDGVPWNNNNAEHAIKLFAKYRRDAGGRFTETSLNDYVVLASVLETCEFNNVNVLRFLLSRETTLDGLMRMAGRKPEQVVPSSTTKMV